MNTELSDKIKMLNSLRKQKREERTNNLTDEYNRLLKKLESLKNEIKDACEISNTIFHDNGHEFLCYGKDMAQIYTHTNFCIDDLVYQQKHEFEYKKPSFTSGSDVNVSFTPQGAYFYLSGILTASHIYLLTNGDEMEFLSFYYDKEKNVEVIRCKLSELKLNGVNAVFGTNADGNELSCHVAIFNSALEYFVEFFSGDGKMTLAESICKNVESRIDAEISAMNKRIGKKSSWQKFKDFIFFKKS